MTLAEIGRAFANTVESFFSPSTQEPSLDPTAGLQLPPLPQVDASQFANPTQFEIQASRRFSETLGINTW